MRMARQCLWHAPFGGIDTHKHTLDWGHIGNVKTALYATCRAVTSYSHYGGKGLIGQPQSTFNPKLGISILLPNQTLTWTLTTLTTAVKADRLVADEP